jgi:hypothetical protein
MFEYFAFGTPPHRDNIVSMASDDVSPHNTTCSSPRSLPPSPEVTAGPSTAPRSCVADLASALSDFGQDDISVSYIPTPSPEFKHGLKVDEDCHDYGYNDEMFLSMDDDYASNECGDGGENTKSKGKAKWQAYLSEPPLASLQNRRSQRQLNTQLQYSITALRSIETLVDEMVHTGRDCNVLPAPTITTASSSSSPSSSCDSITSSFQLMHTSPTSLTTATTAPASNPQPTQAGPPEPPVLPVPDDEGFCEGGDAEDDEGLALTEQMLLSLRRASAPMGVTKFGDSIAARVRTQGPATGSAGANAVVMCFPRMRRKIKTRRKQADGAGR